MSQEESIYGFLANTIAIKTDATTQNTIQEYLVGANTSYDQFSNITNQNRVILKILNTNNQEPIIATGEYNATTEKIEIEITYTKYGIQKIILEDTNELKITNENEIIKADTEGVSKEYIDELDDTKGKAVITIIDNENNKKYLNIKLSQIYVALYTDGTLAFGKTPNPIPTKTVKALYGDISDEKYYVFGKYIGDGTSYTDDDYIYNYTPWYNNRTLIKTVDFVDKIKPKSTGSWLCECRNLTTINNIENLNTKNVTDMSAMFGSCISLTRLDVSNFNTKNVTDMNNMFSYCRKLTSLDVSNFDTSNVTDTNYMFGSCNVLTSLDISNFDTNKVTNMSGMFAACNALIDLDVSSFDTSNVTDMSAMFNSCNTLTSLDVSNFDTMNVKNMSGMFASCSALIDLDVSNFDTSNVTNVRSMFYACHALTSLDLGDFDTSNVTSSAYMMFYGCKSLTSLDVSSFDTSSITDMTYMFYGCSSLTSLDVSNFNTSNVENMFGMFGSCSSLESLDVSSFDTSNVTDMKNMFTNCSALTSLNLVNFNTKNVTDMTTMFFRCTKLKTIYVGADWKLASKRENMFLNCGTSSVTRITEFKKLKQQN